MSLLSQQVASLTKAYRPPVPTSPSHVHRIYDDPDEPIPPKPRTTPREIKWIRASILRAVDNSESPLTITEISDRTKLKWDRVRKSVNRLVEQGKLTQLGETRKHRYAINKENKE